jgi:hypothetical protein
VTQSAALKRCSDVAVRTDGDAALGQVLAYPK